ncbi:RHOMBOID-like protein 8 [Amaranthus tricolor]|uniref:RHOMBOID-like protein 8 n=1 Tax=Amaranthus tricolor TaxID=29722 RepID=UPI00258D1C90|nr:RHOMBOID-like protein 8 [Amaranthus tricolor]
MDSWDMNIKESHEIPVNSTEKKVDEMTGEKRKIPFFGSMSKNVESTWLISFFFIVHLVAFFCTMILNNCWDKSHGDCILLVFQPLSENPLLGPSSSVLDSMGALRRMFLTKDHGVWRIFTAPLLHAGAFHLLISLCSVLLIGVNLEQKFGSLRTGIIYILSAFTGSLMAILFVQNSPEVSSSGALFGLIGASFSGLIRDWKSYNQKFLAVVILLLIFAINFTLGMVPYIDNFSNIAGFISGTLLGFVMFFSPVLRMPALQKGFYDYGFNKSVPLKQKFDRPVLRIVSLILFNLMVAGLIVAVLLRIDLNKNCSWCRYIDCIPSRKWICDVKTPSCKISEIRGQTTLRCLESDNFRILPYTNVSPTRLQELCTLICS